jgi:hypothetical protein
MDGFNVVKSDFSKCGFVFEVGTEKEFGSFEKFRKQLAVKKIAVDWNKMTVNYTNSHNDKLQITYKSGLPVVPESRVPVHFTKLGISCMAESIPEVTINGIKEISYQDWPMIKSPYINMDNSMLKIEKGQTRITVDWRSELPVIKTN